VLVAELVIDVEAMSAAMVIEQLCRRTVVVEQ
jgi:hypothetical protein